MAGFVGVSDSCLLGIASEAVRRRLRRTDETQEQAIEAIRCGLEMFGVAAGRVPSRETLMLTLP